MRIRAIIMFNLVFLLEKHSFLQNKKQKNWHSKYSEVIQIEALHFLRWNFNMNETSHPFSPSEQLASPGEEENALEEEEEEVTR